MSDYSDTFHEQVEHQRGRRRHLFFKIDGDLLFSPAFNKIASSGATVAVLLHVIARETLPPPLKRRRQLEKAGLWPPKKAEPFSFPLREARHHGISEGALAAGLRRLHDVGIITRTSSGSATKRGDFAQYERSDRWRRWGQSDFNKVEWPKAEIENEKGKPIWVRDRGKFTSSRLTKKELAARLTATKSSYTVKVTATKENVAAKVAVNNPSDGPNVAATSTVLVPYTGGPEGFEERFEEDDLKKDRGRGDGPDADVHPGCVLRAGGWENVH